MLLKIRKKSFDEVAIQVYIHVYILIWTLIYVRTQAYIKKFEVLLKKIEKNKCDEIKFQITGLFSSLKAIPSL